MAEITVIKKKSDRSFGEKGKIRIWAAYDLREITNNFLPPLFVSFILQSKHFSRAFISAAGTNPRL